MSCILGVWETDLSSGLSLPKGSTVASTSVVSLFIETVSHSFPQKRT